MLNEYVIFMITFNDLSLLLPEILYVPKIRKALSYRVMLALFIACFNAEPGVKMIFLSCDDLLWYILRSFGFVKSEYLFG